MERFPVFQFGEFVLDSAQRRLLRAGQDVYLPPKTYELLLYLLRNRGRVIRKDELLEGVWPDVNVVENTLAQRIREIREALGDGAHGARFIKTVPRIGYQFIAALDDEPANATLPPAIGAGGQAPGVQAVRDPGAAETRIPADRPKRLALLIPIACAMLAGVTATGYYFGTTRTGLPAGSPDPITSIAVLPCKPLLAEGRDISLELGMADSVMFKLGNLGRITVRPLSAIRRYTDLEQDAVKAGQALRVESVLECHIHRLQDRIRVRVRLLRVRDGELLLAEQFDEDWTDVFTVQDRISQRVAGALALALTGEEQRRLTKRYTENPEAYRAYVRGRYFWSKGTGEGYRTSIEEFQRAIALDRDYALAFAGLADSYNLLGSYGEMPMGEAHQKAKAAAEKAVELDEQIAETHTSLGAIMSSEWDWSAAEKHFLRAIELNRHSTTAHEWFSEYLSWMGRHDEAIRAAQEALTIDVVSLSANSHLGLALYRARQYEGAEKQLRETLELEQDFADAHVMLGVTLVQMGKHSEAIGAFRKAGALTGNSPEILGLLGYGYGMANMKREAQDTLKELDELSGQGRYVSSFCRATVHIGLGEIDLAFKWLHQAYQEREWYLGLLAVDPLFDRLQSDTRYTDLLKRMKLTLAARARGQIGRFTIVEGRRPPAVH